MRPEAELLLCCASTSINAARAERVRTLLHTELDWTYLLHAAGRHGVMPLLSRSLHAISGSEVPGAILGQLRHQSQSNAARNLFLADQLLKIIKLLEAHAISALSYKGPLLSLSIYGHLAQRDFADLDLLVHEHDYERAQYILSTSGYRLIKAFENESTYVDSSGEVAVDLHQRMSPRSFPSPLQFEHLWERRLHTILQGRKVPTLSLEDTLLMLAIQITKDAGTPYLQLAKICDIDQLLRTHPDFDLTGALSQASELGCERMVLLSLCLAYHLLGTPLPQKTLGQLHAQPAIDQLVEFTRRQLFDDYNPNSRDQRSIDRFRWLIRERLRDKLYPYYSRYIYNTFVPCNLDRQLVHLPQHFAFLYYAIRPIRLVYKYAAVLFKVRHGRDMST